MKITQAQGFNVPVLSNKEHAHIRARANEILDRDKPKILMRGKIQVLQNGNTCAPSIWKKNRFTKTL